MSRYLDGENLAPLTTASARALIGKRVVYLRSQDIDRSGRGYFFPKSGTVMGVFRKHIAMDYAENYIGTLSSIVELVLDPAETEPVNNNAPSAAGVIRRDVGLTDNTRAGGKE